MLGRKITSVWVGLGPPGGYDSIAMSDITTPDSAEEGREPELTYAPVVGSVVGEKTPAQARMEVRLWCSIIFAMCFAMMGLARYLNPDPSGVGTHQQLGLPPCGWEATLHLPCPTCGCTTAVSFFAHAHPLKSLLTQPFGFTVALLATVLLPLTFWGMITGRWKGPSTFTLGWYWPWWTYGSIGLLAAAWVYKLVIARMNITF
jgi:hypothetical protein